MVKSIHHRGPDGNGILQFNNALLGHTRLSIVDIEGGVQPMSNSENTIAITFNGEIYGYKDIKKNWIIILTQNPILKLSWHYMKNMAQI
ncbi:MAG: hypothetical protein HC905_26000 [Bacteroidales bacterium]|nr:hypothetical protein [Bacteroidales bacterium]